MSGKRKSITSITYKGRSFGIIILTAAQLLIGIIHTLIGIQLITTGSTFMQATEAYNIYTVVFGLLVIVFAVFIWQGKKVGWIGTIGVSVFVSVVDTLTVLNLSSIPGIPVFAAPTEIGYSVIITLYLLQTKVRKKFWT